MSKFRLKLYISRLTPAATRAVQMLEELCRDELQGSYELEVIDITENPQLAEHERIIATPTLIKDLPPPMRRIIGDLSDRQKVLLGLDLHGMEDQ